MFHSTLMIGSPHKNSGFISNNISSNGNTGLYMHETNSRGDEERNYNCYSRDITILQNLISNNNGFGIDSASIRDVDIFNNLVLNNTNTGINVKRL